MDFNPLFLAMQEKAKIIEPLLIKEIDKLVKDKVLQEPIDYALNCKAKRLRPALVLFAAELIGRKQTDFISVALAFEFLHNFTLFHDDIMDNATVRRGQETVKAKYGVDSAIVCGDALFACAFNQMCKLKENFADEKTVEAIKIFTQTSINTAAGQLEEVDLQSKENATLKEYLEVIRKKTGAVFSGLLETTMLLGNASKEQISALKEFGYLFGEVFQIQDDILDLVGCDEFGKFKGTDIKEGKKTILALHALKTLQGNDLIELKQILNKKSDDTTDKEIQNAIKLFEKSGSIEFAKKRAQSLTKKGKDLLKVFPDNQAKTFFNQLIEYALTRTK